MQSAGCAFLGRRAAVDRSEDFMQRVLLFLLLTLMAVSTLVAQQTTPVMPGGVIVTPTSPAGPTTPVITLGTSSPNPAGATAATPGNQAGATNSTLQQTVTGGAPQTVYTAPVITNMPKVSALSEGGATEQVGPRNLIMGGPDSAWAISNETVSVAEAARKARALRASKKSRVFTNADIARLRSNDAVSVVGTPTTPVTNERTMPASDVPEEQVGPTTPAVPNQNVQPPPPQQNPVAPKSPFRPKPSPTQPR